MSSSPSPAQAGSFDPVFDSQAVFRALLDAMARPGLVVHLPVRDPRCPVPSCQPLAAMLLTLLDHEVTFAVAPETGHGDGVDALVSYLAAATGSRAVAVEEADFVVAPGAPPAGLLRRLRRGSPAFPDESATLLILVPALDPAGNGPEVSLAGPGVRSGGKTIVRLPGLTPADLVDLAEVNAEPPLGIDLILVDAAGSLTGLPRSTRLTLLSGGSKVNGREARGTREEQ